MTVQRVKCSAAAYTHRLDQHMVTDRRWTLTDSVGVETIVCGLACVITIACRWLPADVGADRRETGNGAAA